MIRIFKDIFSIFSTTQILLSVKTLKIKMFEREVNPQNIESADIAVVIPSYNEADSITHPTHIASEGLIKYFPNLKAVIINADNASPDNTEKVFLKTQTQVPKIYITTPKNTPGKGWNFLNAFRKCHSLGVKTIVCVDADLISITPEWIKYMAEPIIYEGYDYLTPLYSRHKYDGTITNNICYPIVYGIFGKDIRQPIGGDFALSDRLATYFLKQPWHKTTHEYGIDIFMTMNAITGGFRIAQVGLGSKIHKPSAPKLGPMFVQVVNTALLTVLNNTHKWKNINSIEKSQIFGLQKLEPAQNLEVNREDVLKNAVSSFENSREVLKSSLSPEIMEKLESGFSSQKLNINSDLWVDILFDVLCAFPKHPNPQELVEAMKGLYFGRVYGFMNETWEMSSAEAEIPIREQGEKVFKRRGELIRRLDFIQSARKSSSQQQKPQSEL